MLREGCEVMFKSKRGSVALAAAVFVCLAASLLPTASAASVRAGGGRRFALLVGVNRYPYLPREKQLSWAVNDAEKIRRALVEEFDFPARNVSTLYNEDATRAGILRALRDAATRSGRGDVFVLFYSGHGTLFPDSKSEALDETQVIGEVVDADTQAFSPLREPDKFDSAVCPSDVGGPSTSGKRWDNLILDDELFDIFSEFTSKGCEVVLLADSCNSGSLARGLSAPGDASRYEGAPSYGDRPKYISPRLALGRDWRDIPAPRSQRVRARSANDLDGRFIAITAAKDNELAWESERGGGGYFTQAFVAAAAGKNNVATFECLFRALKRQVKGLKSIQEPQMDTRFFAGEPTDSLFLSYAEPSRLKVLVKITDARGRDLPGASFAVLKGGVSPRERLTESNVLLAGHSDFGGLYDSGCPQVAAGTYWVVAYKAGYKSFERRVAIEENAPGVAVLRISLAGM
jgi:hypothetical protein